MKQKTLLIILICFCAVLIAETGKPSSQRYEVNKEFDLFFKQVKSVTLSQATVLLGSVRVLRIVPDGNFWILDSRGIKINRYKPDGTFISSIGGSGQGPGEYLTPVDFFFGKECIYVVDNLAIKLNVLNMDGNFKYFFSIQDGRAVQESKTGDIVIAAPLVPTMHLKEQAMPVPYRYVILSFVCSMCSVGCFCFEFRILNLRVLSLFKVSRRDLRG